MKKVYKKKIGITGGKGVLGTHFINRYKKKYHFILYNKRIENYKHLQEWLTKNSDIEVIIHLAGLVSIKKTKSNQKKTNLVNTLSSIKLLNILNKIKNNEIKYFLFASSSHVYSPSKKKLKENSQRLPKTFYGLSKKKVEDFIIKNKKKYKFAIGVARIFNFYSKKQKDGFFVYDLSKKIREAKNKLLVNKTNTLRDFINLDQLTEMVDFMIKNKIADPLNLGSGKSINLSNLLINIKNKINKNLSLSLNKKYYPGLVANINLLRRLGYKKKIREFKI